MVDALLPLTVTNAQVSRRGKQILGPVDLTFAPVGFTIVIGPNGAGKTTLMKSLYGIERLSKGQIKWAVSNAVARNNQAFVFQRPIMLRRSVRDNLAYPLQVAGVPKAEVARRTSDWASRIGLSDAMDRPAPRLSGGEQQKLALARALIQEPAVLFLDEPCASLDGPATRDIETILQAAYAAGTRVIMTTHNLGQLHRLATDVIFLLGGQVHESGPAEEVLTDPKTPALKAFLKGDIV